MLKILKSKPLVISRENFWSGLFISFWKLYVSRAMCRSAITSPMSAKDFFVNFRISFSSKLTWVKFSLRDIFHEFNGSDLLYCINVFSDLCYEMSTELNLFSNFNWLSIHFTFCSEMLHVLRTINFAYSSFSSSESMSSKTFSYVRRQIEAILP